MDARGLDVAARYIAGVVEEEKKANPGGWRAVLCSAELVEKIPRGLGGERIDEAGLPRGLDANGLDEAVRYIAGILEEERRASPGGWSAVLCCADVTYIVGGISQGGGLSLYLMCRKALGSFADGSDASSLPFSASIGLSTWLPKCSLIPAPGVADAAGPERAARHPLFMAHGKYDDLVAYTWGKDCSHLLRDAGFTNLSFKSYPKLGHDMCREELEDMRAWLLEHAPPPA
ncbi:unnamed protein product [Closterium sp. Naga37s-1]|nr:unnamed protein product [Closterium sp. Naga37s-1]